MGTGIKRIRDAISELNLPEPEFTDREHYFFTTVYDKDFFTSQSLTEGLTSLLSVIKMNPGIKAKDISEVLNRPIKTVERHVKTLQEKSYIVRRGSRKTGGYWEVVM